VVLININFINSNGVLIFDRSDTLTQGLDFDGSITSGSGNGGALVQDGAGTTILNGNNTYSKGTTVNEGTLLVNNTSGSGTGNGTVTVNGGTLGGSGTVRAITLNSGGAVNPGTSLGTLHGSSLAWNSDDTLPGMAFDLSTTDNTSDLLDLSGAFTKGAGSDFLFDFTGGLVGQTYTLVEFGNTNFSAGDFGVNSGISGTFAFEGNTLQFNSTAADAIIPEPSTLLVWALLGLLGLGLGRRRRGR